MRASVLSLKGREDSSDLVAHLAVLVDLGLQVFEDVRIDHGGHLLGHFCSFRDDETGREQSLGCCRFGVDTGLMEASFEVTFSGFRQCQMKFWIFLNHSLSTSFTCNYPGQP
jgi:hypothetical protein